MPSSHALDRTEITFDDDHGVANAGLLLTATLSGRLGLEALVEEMLDLGDRPAAARPGRKVMTLVASMVAGGDTIDDADALRSRGWSSACCFGAEPDDGDCRIQKGGGHTMNCYVCARERLDSTAVAVCRHCGAALCLLHVDEEAATPRPGGLYTTCTHDTWSSPAREGVRSVGQRGLTT